MSHIVHDLFCAKCDEFERSVLYRRTDGRPACGVCGSDRRVAWLDPPRMLAPWTPIPTATGMIETRADFDKMVAKVRKDNPGKELRIAGETEQTRSVRSDEARHRNVTNLKSKGYSQQDVRERKSELKAKKLERSASK